MVVRRIARAHEHKRLSELIQQCAFRDALDLAVRDLGAELGQYAMALLGDRDEAERVVISALCDFHSAMPTLGAAAPRPYLFGLVRQGCQQAASHGPDTRQHGLGTTGASLANQDAHSNGQTHMEAGPVLMRRQLAGLGEEERDGVLLRYLGRLSYDDIGALCHLSAGQARRRVGKALLRLRNQRIDWVDDLDAQRDQGRRS